MWIKGLEAEVSGVLCVVLKVRFESVAVYAHLNGGVGLVLTDDTQGRAFLFPDQDSLSVLLV